MRRRARPISARSLAVALLLCALVASADTASAEEPSLGPTRTTAAPAARFTEAPQRYVDPLFASVDGTYDVVYGSSVNVDGVLEQHAADIYAPSGDTEDDRPLIIWIHGGSFSSGDKSQMASFAIDSAKRGFVSASIDYRLRPDLDVYDPTQVVETLEAIRDAGRDAQAAVRYFRQHADQYGIDPSLVAVGGYSAGAVTSLWVDFNEEQAESAPWGGQSSRISAAVSLAGAYGGNPTHGDPPIVMFHGTTDTTVPYQFAVDQCNAQIAAGNVCEFHSYPTGHLLSPWFTEIRNLATDFLYRFVTCGLPFSDVRPTDTLCGDVDWMATNGLSTGYPDGTFRPTDSITRQTLIAFLWRMAGEPTGYPDPGFTDVDPASPFADAIAWAAAGGIASGYADGTFRPTASLSRQAAAAFLHRFVPFLP